MSTVQDRLDTIRHYLETNGAPSQVSVTEQLDHLLFLGNILGLYDAVDHVRRCVTEQESPAAKFRRLNAAMDRANEELGAHYLPRVHALLAKGDIEGARTLTINEIPSDSITHVFALDAISQAKKKELLK